MNEEHEQFEPDFKIPSYLSIYVDGDLFTIQLLKEIEWGLKSNGNITVPLMDGKFYIQTDIGKYNCWLKGTFARHTLPINYYDFCRQLQLHFSNNYFNIDIGSKDSIKKFLDNDILIVENNYDN